MMHVPEQFIRIIYHSYQSVGTLTLIFSFFKFHFHDFIGFGFLFVLQFFLSDIESVQRIMGLFLM